MTERLRICAIVVESSFPVLAAYFAFLNAVMCRLGVANLMLYAAMMGVDVALMWVNLFYVQIKLAPHLAQNTLCAHLLVIARLLMYFLAIAVQYVKMSPTSCPLTMHNLLFFALAQIPRGGVIWLVALHPGPEPPQPVVDAVALTVVSVADAMDSGDCCPICLDQMDPRAEPVCRAECHHCFHSRCISVWLESKGTCPLCRIPLRMP
jgi:hypothetical protein